MLEAALNTQQKIAKVQSCTISRITWYMQHKCQSKKDATLINIIHVLNIWSNFKIIPFCTAFFCSTRIIEFSSMIKEKTYYAIVVYVYVIWNVIMKRQNCKADVHYISKDFYDLYNKHLF